MNGLMGMGPIGWLAALVVGFVVGGIFFLTIKVQVAYVLKRKADTPAWVVPALMYARMLFVGAVLVVIALSLPHEKIAGALLAGCAGSLIARMLVSRMVKKGGST